MYQRTSNGSATRVLIVACRTAADDALMDAVSRRAAASPCEFTLLVPRPCHGLHRVVDPEEHGWDEAQAVIDTAGPLLARAAGAPVRGMVGSHDPVAAVEDALNVHGFDEVIVSTLPVRVSRWLHLDLPAKVSGMGVRVTRVTQRASAAPSPAAEPTALPVAADRRPRART
jgi:hypothetical protein